MFLVDLSRLPAGSSQASEQHLLGARGGTQGVAVVDDQQQHLCRRVENGWLPWLGKLAENQPFVSTIFHGFPMASHNGGKFSGL